MATNEGIRSTFPTQPSARSPKLRIYESLFLPLRGSGETPTTSISMSSAARKYARSRVCRRVSALSLTPPSPKKKNAGKPSKSGRKSAPGSAGSPLRMPRAQGEKGHD